MQLTANRCNAPECSWQWRSYCQGPKTQVSGFALRRRRRTRAAFLKRKLLNTNFPSCPAEALISLPVRSCLIDGEAIVVGSTGLSVFDLIR